jgi:GR25 family glycosyltransferase involved in LPS biosynthesis
MDLLQHTLYINLEHRTDRLEHVQRELSKLGIVGERFNAIKVRVGAIGCSMSHIKCLELAKERDWEQVFICEDDITFLNPQIFKNSLQRFSENKDLPWDVLIIGGNNAPPYQKIDESCIRISNCQTTTGYIVKKHYYEVLIQNFRESVTNLIREPTNHRMYALDVYWKNLQRVNHWYMLMPVTVVQCDSYSDIEERHVDYRGLMLDVDKPWLFRK